MVKPEYERQRRYYDKRIKTGAIRRVEYRPPTENYVQLKDLAMHWDCSLSAAIKRAVLEAWEREGKPLPYSTGDAQS